MPELASSDTKPGHVGCAQKLVADDGPSGSRSIDHPTWSILTMTNLSIKTVVMVREMAEGASGSDLFKVAGTDNCGIPVS